MSEMEEIENTIIRLWENGTPVTEICRTLPIKQYATRKKIKEMKESGVLSPRRGKGETTVDKVLYLYNKGVKNPYEIAEHYGISVNTVYSIFKSKGIKRKRPPHNYKERKLSEIAKTILSMLDGGKTPRQVARELDISTQFVYIIKKRRDSKNGN